MAFFFDDYVLATLVIDYCYQIFFFVITIVFNTHKVTDFAGGTSFMLMALLSYFTGENGDFAINSNLINTALVTVWGLRLVGFLFYRILVWRRDQRFNDALVARIVFWNLQAIWSWSVSLPLIISNYRENTDDINAQDIVGWVIWAIGFGIESVADFQKTRYKLEVEAEDPAWCCKGLWKYSRHPNYFGEILLWWGIFISASNNFEGADWVSVLGPIFLVILLLFVSGIPIIERKYDDKFCEDVRYKGYINRTSPLIPLPTSCYAKLPMTFKTVLLCEFHFYNPKTRSTKTSEV